MYASSEFEVKGKFLVLLFEQSTPKLDPTGLAMSTVEHSRAALRSNMIDIPQSRFYGE